MNQNRLQIPEADRQGIQSGSLSWLAEIEFVEDPRFINNLKLNILSVSTKIKEVEILSYYLHERKDMLIWLDLSWWGKKRYEDELKADVGDVVSQMLPNFRLRVVTDRKIIQLASKRVLKAYAGKDLNGT